MDSKLLTPEELSVERQIRGLVNESEFHRLDRILEEEALNEQMIPLNIHNIRSVNTEQRECASKCEELCKLAEKGIKENDGQILQEAKSRLLHLKQRLVRLLRHAPNLNSAIKPLQQEVEQQLALLSLVNQDTSLSSGESPAHPSTLSTPLAEDVTLLNPKAKGAKPKLPNPKALKGPNQGPKGSPPPAANNKGPRKSLHTMFNKALSLADFSVPPPPLPSLPLNSSREQQWSHNIPHKVSQSHPNIDGELNQGRVLFQPERNSTAQVPRYPNPLGYQPAHNQVFEVSLPRSDSEFDSRRNNAISSWRLKFSGRSGSLSVEEFFFRVEVLAAGERLPHEHLVSYVHQMLEGKASDWYWLYRRKYPCLSWNQLKGAMLREFQDYTSDLDIRRYVDMRKQGGRESFADFRLDIESKVARMRNPIKELELVEITRRNMKPALQNALAKDIFSNMDTLQDACQIFERLWLRLGMSPDPGLARRVNEISYDEHPEDTQICAVQGSEDTQICAVQGSEEPKQILSKEYLICWNCHDMGHGFMDCPSPPLHIFCFGCGAEGTVKPKCSKCRLGNRTAGNIAPGNMLPQKYSQQPRNNLFQPNSRGHSPSRRSP